MMMLLPQGRILGRKKEERKNTLVFKKANDEEKKTCGS